MANKTTGNMKCGWATPLTSDSSTQLEELGILREHIDEDEGHKVYKYVQIDASSAAIANGTVCVTTGDLYFRKATTVCDAAADRNQPIGVGIGTITAGNYGWLQVRGYHSAVKTNGDDDIAIGQALIVDAEGGTDGTCDSVAVGTAPTHKVIGWALAADVDASNTVAAQLCII